MEAVRAQQDLEAFDRVRATLGGETTKKKGEPTKGHTHTHTHTRHTCTHTRSSRANEQEERQTQRSHEHTHTHTVTHTRACTHRHMHVGRKHKKHRSKHATKGGHSMWERYADDSEHEGAQSHQ